MIVGIDLGTTNCALATVASAEAPSPEIFALTQLVKPGDVQTRPTLPSFLYLASDGELPAGSLDLPWASDRRFLVGEAARERGSEVPLRLVSSAKSWLSHAGADRQAPILPQGAPEGTEKVSPVTAAVRYLEHLRDAYDATHESKLDAQDILLTVPASFDAVARELTQEAAITAGLPNVTLLEEPQAAFYAWLASVGDGWRDKLSSGDRVLVCDVGGGTTDFSLIAVKDDGGGNLELERVAVGDHILLGGDNMDLALAHALMQKLAAAGKKLDASQQRALVMGARRAKETLLTDASVESVPLTILGRGSKLIGNKIRTELLRAELESILLEGFFPACAADAKPQEARRTGFMEIGLPFVQDAAITRHLAQFLARHGAPSHVLFNGGVFNSALLRARLIEIIGSWGTAPQVLEEDDTDLAVAKGAAYYGAVRAGGGIRIRGGVARSYYVGMETAAPAVPGVAPPVRALCVVPFGLEEGSSIDVPGVQLGLVVGEPATFRFFSATHRKADAPGLVLDEFTWPDQLEETAPITATIEADGLEPGTVIPVTLAATVTELGTLELWSVAQDGQRFKLEYNVRAVS
ncbi:MAG: Hsp70 family protein [Deltaproteobacteria bacterium]